MRRTVDALAALRLVWRRARWPTAAQYALALLSGALPVVAATAAKALFDAIGDRAGSGRIAVLAVLVALVTVAVALLVQPAVYLAAVVSARVTVAVEDELYRGVNASTGLGPFENPQYLSRLRLAEQAAGEAPHSVGSFALTFVQGGVTAVGLLVSAVAVWPPMALLVAGSVVVNVLVQRRLARVGVAAAETVSETARRQYLYRSVLTDARSVKEVRLFGLGEFFRLRMLREVRASVAAQVHAQRRTSQLGAALTLLSGLAAGAGLVVVAARAARGEATVGDLTLFLAAAAGTQSSVQGIATEWGRARAAAELFGSFRALTEPAPSTDGTIEPGPLRDGIALRDVWFRYSPDGPWVLRGLDLTVPAGSSLALVGLNGAGKSTLVKLLCRLYEPERGSITWDGVDLREFAAPALRRRIAVTFQDFMPFDLSARENIALGDLERADDDALLRRAAGRAGADTIVAALPRGYDTMLSRSFDDAEANAGVTLSGGQWQRIALARSLARERADLLILDEPSSGLDAESEAQIHRALAAHRAGRTSILVSHRLSAVRAADRIVTLRDGVVAEAGTHAELLARGGEYARLFALQADGYADLAVGA